MHVGGWGVACSQHVVRHAHLGEGLGHWSRVAPLQPSPAARPGPARGVTPSPWGAVPVTVIVTAVASATKRRAAHARAVALPHRSVRWAGAGSRRTRNRRAGAGAGVGTDPLLPLFEPVGDVEHGRPLAPLKHHLTPARHHHAHSGLHHVPPSRTCFTSPSQSALASTTGPCQQPARAGQRAQPPLARERRARCRPVNAARRRAGKLVARA